MQSPAEKYSHIKSLFEEKADADAAVSMSAYMKNRFLFYGIKAPVRKAVYQEFIREERKQKQIDREFLDLCLADEHREFQYLIYDYLLALKRFVTFEDLPRIKRYITEKPWWDTTDLLCKVIGDVSLRDPRVKDEMLCWSTEENLWVRRASIEHQMSLKDKTDAELLGAILVNCFGTNEFFINKAIGCSLRDYAKTNPLWVKEFLARHEEEMSVLSRKEAGKYL